MTMRFGTVTGPEQIEAMSRVLEAYCMQAGITDESEREDVAARIVSLHEIGVSGEDELLAALACRIAKEPSTVS
jgi:hypothetical protein